MHSEFNTITANREKNQPAGCTSVTDHQSRNVRSRSIRLCCKTNIFYIEQQQNLSNIKICGRALEKIANTSARLDHCVAGPYVLRGDKQDSTGLDVQGQL